MFRVPQSSDSFNGSTREMNAFHHTQLNEAETVIWNRVFSSSMLNEARANVAGWNWKDLENNPEGPWGLPSIYIQRVDGSGTIGTIQPDNHLDFGIGAPGLFDQKTIGVKNTLTKVMKSHTLKMGGEITHMTFVDTAPWSARPSYYFNNMWDFLNDAPSAENATFDPRTGVPTDFRKDTRQTLYALFVQDNYKMRPNLTLTFGLRWERFGSISEKNDNLSSVVLGSGANALTGMSLRLGGTLYEVEQDRFRTAGWRHVEPGQVQRQDGPARRLRHRLQRARPGHLTERPQQSAVPLCGRQSDRQPDRLRRQQLPGRRQRVLRLRVEPGHYRQLRSEHQPAGAGPELRA